MGTEVGWVPFNERAARDPDRLGRYYAEWFNMRSALSQVPRAGPMYAFPRESSIKIFDVIRDHLRQVVT